MLDRVFLKENLMGAAMQAAVVRNDVINDNIANADTPGFKKRSVNFEVYFRNELEKGDGQVNFNNLQPVITRQDTGFKYRTDENNVDIEIEMVDLYQNTVRYDVLTNAVMSDYKRINLALTGIK